MSSTTPAIANGSMPTTGASTAAATGGAAPETLPLIVVHPYATVSVKSHVPVTLVLKNSNYTK